MTDVPQLASETVALTQPIPAKPLPAARWADPSLAMRKVPLALPVVDDAGRTWSEIHVRRFTTGQVAVIVGNWIEASKADPDAPLAFPSYVDEAGAEVPAAVMALLDDDDMQDVREMAEGFLPRRFRPDRARATSPDASGPSTSGTTGPSSGA